MGNSATRSTAPSEKPSHNFLDIDILQTVEAKQSKCYEKQVPCKSKSQSADEQSISVTGAKTCQKSTQSSTKISEDASHEASQDLPSGAKHPGLLRYLHMAAYNIKPECFEGATFNLEQSISRSFLVGHTIGLTSISPGGYRLSTRYMPARKQQFVLVDVDPTGNWNVDLRCAPTKNTRGSLAAQLSGSALLFFESAYDWYWSKSTASLQIVNEKTIALHYLQAFSDKFSLGAEVVLKSGIAEASAASAAARFADHDWVISSTLNKRGIELSYKQAARPRLNVAAILELGFMSHRRLATLAYEYRGDFCIVHGSVDTDGRVGATVKYSLVATDRARISCAISGLANHTNNKFQLGFKLTGTLI